MGDADDSYDFCQLDAFVEKLRDGYDLVMGNRFHGGITARRHAAAAPLSRQSGADRRSAACSSAARAATSIAACAASRATPSSASTCRPPGMEFASEMVVKATLHGLRIAEVPTTLSPDGRIRPPHLRSWRDGWRHLRFLLLFSPAWLFLYPGLLLFFSGLLLTAWLLPGPRRSARSSSTSIRCSTRPWRSSWACNRCSSGHSPMPTACTREYFRPNAALNRLLSLATVERGLMAAAILLLIGLMLGVLAVSSWSKAAFGLLDPTLTMRVAIPSAVCIVLAFEIAYGVFVLNVLGIRESRPDKSARSLAGQPIA